MLKNSGVRRADCGDIPVADKPEKEGLNMKKVAVVIGSDSDLPVVSDAIKQLKELEIPIAARIISAHRSPDEAESFAKAARDEGFGVIIAGAGKSAHLAGVLAAHTTLPVIGVPIKTPDLGGLDSLLSIVQMPRGVPVATVAIDGAGNAGLLAAQILAVSDDRLAARLAALKGEMRDAVARKDEKLQGEIEAL